MSVEEDQQYLEDGSGNPEFVADVSLVEEEKPYEFKHRETTFFPPVRPPMPHYFPLFLWNQY